MLRCLVKHRICLHDMGLVKYRISLHDVGLVKHRIAFFGCLVKHRMSS